MYGRDTAKETDDRSGLSRQGIRLIGDGSVRSP